MIGKLRPVIWIGEPDGFSESARAMLEQHFIVILKKVTSSELKEVFSNCDVFLFRLGINIPAELIQKNQRCKILATPVTGLNHIDLNACQANQIQILSLQGESEFLKGIRATAELTFALILGLLRNIVPASHQLNNGVFNRDLFRGKELYLKTIGIIGYGRLGKIVSDYALAFGMKVLIYEKDINRIANDTNFEFVNLDLLIQNSDIISLHIDGGPLNYHFADKSFFSNMKKSAYLINTSRGQVLDESALLNALLNAQIAGAALDVLQEEPNVSEDNPLIQYAKYNSNLLITPHLGGNTYESFEKTECFIAAKIIQTLQHV